MPEVGDTRDARHEVEQTVFKHRDHYNARGVAKTPLTLARAQQIVIDHNSGLTGREYKRCRLDFYVCSICHKYHVGHVAPRQAT